MISYSQSGQDTFAWEASGRKMNGKFLDIGCNDPKINNNTYALEQLGWKGVCIDILHFDYSNRISKFIKADARTLDYGFVASPFVDYLSLDCDECSREVMEALPWSRVRFGAVSLEHDVYKDGPALKDWAKSFLLSRGYRLYRDNVLAPVTPGMPWSGQPYEDWFVAHENIIR